MPTTRQSYSVPCRTEIGIDGIIKTSFALLTMMVRSAPNGRVRIRSDHPGDKAPEHPNSNPSRPAFIRHGDKIPGVDRKSIGQCPYSQFQTAAYVLTGKPASREARNRLFTDTHSERSPPTPFTQTASLTRKPREMVEPDGIEPTTSCLQSTRSPN